MDIQIKKISEYSHKNLQSYFNGENLKTLHDMKLYVDDLYYNTGEVTGFSDEQYDMLVDTLKKRDPTYVVPIGVQIRKGENRVIVPYHMGSMNKIRPDHPEEVIEFNKWKKPVDYIIEEKLDGVSCLIVVKKGKYKLYKRPGKDGYGADISYLLQYFSTIPNNLKNDIIVRGELIMKKKDFETKYSKEYANPRNFVAGRTGGKTVGKGLTDIDFIAYEKYYEDGIEGEKPSDQLKELKRLGFTTVRNEVVSDVTIDSMSETLLRFKEESKYEIDGIIVQYDKSYERNVSGNPDYAFAFKMRLENNLAETIVIGVHWEISKWGFLRPTIDIEPVMLAGNKVTAANGKSAKYIVDNKIGPGTVVLITRSGEVIPDIVKVIKGTEPDMPEIPYLWNKNNVNIYTETHGDLMCIKLIANFFDKLGIKHVGEATVRKMYDHGLNSLIKIIMANKQQFQEIDGFGADLAERTYNNIHNGLKDVSLANILGSSGIFGFGIGRKKIQSLLDDIPDIFTIYKNMNKKELQNYIIQHAKGYSDITAKYIVDNIAWADRFIRAMKLFATFKTKVIVGNNLNGMKIVFTGFRDKKLEEETISRGGKVTTSVSRNTSILVVASKSGKPSGKIKTAIDLNAAGAKIEILEKLEFETKYIK